MSFKETLKLPKTDMPIKANLPASEPEVYALWNNGGVYRRMRRQRHHDPDFVLHDGPPYANGSIHIGHAMNKILKDFIVKQHYFSGQSVEFVPGWDCHGLPIEKKARDVSDDRVTTRRKCREYAQQQLDIQREEFKTLGVIADWDHPYTTMAPQNESRIFDALRQLAADHLLFQRQKPVYWSWAEQTALAEAEIEYKDREDDAVYVAFEIKLDSSLWNKIIPDEHDMWTAYRNGESKAALLVWTTTPWTLPSNAAVAIHPDEEYVACWCSVEVNVLNHPHGALPLPLVFMAKKRFDAMVEKGIAKDVFATVMGSELADGVTQCVKPLAHNMNVPVICEDFVDMHTGTGCVHIAPGHGVIDYQVGQKHNLPVYQPVDERGNWTQEVYVALGRQHTPMPGGIIDGQHVLKFGNEFVIESLRNYGNLLLKEKITHSYPHCWRSGTPVIFRATDQWYVDLEPLRPAAIDAVENTTFVPEVAKNRLMAMVKDREDWCISRQRAWGVPIAFLRHKKTGRAWFFEDILAATSAQIHNDTERWWELPVESFLPEHYKYKPDDFEKVEDILDVWFDSGLSWSFIDSLTTRPADVYCEGSDQHRGWFQSSLWLGLAISKEAPFKKIISHGFVVDEKGEKMAKSKGNVVSPETVLKQYGAEVLRYWVATTDYTREMRLSDPILKRCSEGYRKLRNTLRYLVANLDSERNLSLRTKAHDTVRQEDLMPIDFWILSKASEVFGDIHRLYAEYDFCRGTHMLNDFIHAELSGIWMSAAKDRLYCGNRKERNSAQYTVFQLLRSMLGLVAPLFTYTAAEVLGHCPYWFVLDVIGLQPKSPDIFDLVYQPLQVVASTPHVLADDIDYWQEALDSFNVAFDLLKKDKKVSDKLDVFVESNGKTFFGVEDWFGVSKYQPSTQQEALTTFDVQGDQFKIVLSSQAKCQRCWKRTVETRELCSRCQGVVG
jgi:isoleucyl-tRNA synthetase